MPAQGAPDLEVEGQEGRLVPLAALRAECEQGLRYIEDVLGRPPAENVEGEENLPPLDTLDSSSPRRDWDRWGKRLRDRRAAIDRFAAQVAKCGKKE